MCKLPTCPLCNAAWFQDSATGQDVEHPLNHCELEGVCVSKEKAARLCHRLANGMAVEWCEREFACVEWAPGEGDDVDVLIRSPYLKNQGFGAVSLAAAVAKAKKQS